jgi:hypothetical protein
LKIDAEEWKDLVVCCSSTAGVGPVVGMCADARAEATTAPKQRAYPQVEDVPAKPDKPAMTADEQAKLKKDLIDARDRQTSKAKQGATRPKPIQP